ncbi:Retrovirus-related Pol polyprotein from transposon opus [Sesamum angolense]|uniref:Retrovirus-related Pol polyprotein from transposon opus n=1 Tax=Sesamum angolense TaxID=2727404 RepID=A0AAE2BQH0_9LAMI|nr:Retrovirus-related Pol polyprotein from transposon opus [Sesamum angolense]
MPFGLKNAGATYQRLVNNMFREQIGKNMVVYIDDMMVKSQKKENHKQDLQECFGILQHFGMKLNPIKCTFGVHGGKFLGFMISQRGIEANPEKIKAILEMKPPKTIQEVQRLTGRLAALNRFISRSSDRGSHFSRKDGEVGSRVSEYGIEYHPRPAIKAQALVDFVVEMTAEEGEHKQQWWKLFVDGSSTLQGSGAGVILETPQGDKIQYALRFSFDASNNEAEYEALLAGGRLAQAAGAKYLKAYSDSQLVVNQVNGDYEAKGEKMIQYLNLIRTLCQKFEKFELQRVPRSNNEEADQLAKLASSLTTVQNRKMTLLTQDRSGIEDPANEILVNTSKPCWKDTIEAYFDYGSLPADRKEARIIRTRATRFTMIRGELYKRGFSQPYLKCLDPEKAEYVLKRKSMKEVAKSLGRKITSRQDLTTRILLAFCTKRCHGYGTPQYNGQTEVTNRTILQHLKTHLDQAKGNWVDELPGVLWAYRTTPRRSTGESPFNLVYGMKAIIPAEIGEETLRIQQYEPEINDIGRRVNLDLLGSVKEIRCQGNIGKLDAKWEGPYRVIEAIGNATYKLKKPDGKEIPRTWNASNLKKFYA